MLNNIRYANIIYNISPQRNLLIPNFFPEKRINENITGQQTSKKHFLQEICYKVKKYQQLAK